MGMQINTNIAANNSYRNLSNTQNDLSKSLEKLSSGLRINRAADDAAGLAISEGLRSQVGGLTVAARNAHAQDIVAELSSSLDVDAWDGADGLLALYNYVSSARDILGSRRELIAELLDERRAVGDQLAALRQVPSPQAQAVYLDITG
jgi:flagellin